MVAPRRIRCKVVAIPVLVGRSSSASARDLLPSADPYIVGLIKKLQIEVRRERASLASVRRRGDLNQPQLGDWHEFDADVFDEAELPWDDDQFEFEPCEDDPLADEPSDSDDLSVGR